MWRDGIDWQVISLGGQLAGEKALNFSDVGREKGLGKGR